MKEQSYQQFAIVQANTASTLTDLLNSKLKELKDKDPVVTFDGLTARIQYTERINIPEDLEDMYRLKGVSLTCGSCPFFEPTKKGDGTTDERTKKGKCPCASYGIAFEDGPVCETLFKMINSGEVGLCLKK